MTTFLPPPTIDPGVPGRSRVNGGERRDGDGRRLLGERRLGRRLDRELGGVATVLHDRCVPDHREPIDHLVVAPNGVWVVVADHSDGRLVHRRRASGPARLGLGGADHGAALLAPTANARRVAVLAARIGFDWVDVHPVLCFTSADWGVTGRPFQVDDVHVTHARALVEAIADRGPLAPADARTLAVELGMQLPPAGGPRPTVRV